MKTNRGHRVSATGQPLREGDYLRGQHLANDLRMLINNDRYYDLLIQCSDGKQAYAYCGILAARSTKLSELLRASCPNEDAVDARRRPTLNFPDINVKAMEIVLEFLHCGSLSEGTLTEETIVDAYHAASKFDLADLVNDTMACLKDLLRVGDFDLAAKILTQAVEKMGLENNDFLETVACHLAAAEFHRSQVAYDNMSTNAFQALLQMTASSDVYFASTEYQILRYSILLCASRVAPAALQDLEERIPAIASPQTKITWPENDPGTHAIATILGPIVEFIDLRRLESGVIDNQIEPLNLVSRDLLFGAFKYLAIEKKPMRAWRGGMLRWSADHRSPHVSLSEDGSTAVVSEPDSRHCVRACIAFASTGKYEWDVTYDVRNNGIIGIGVCDETLSDFANVVSVGTSSSGWILHNGGCSHAGKTIDYGRPLGQKGTVRVHIDMGNREIAFTIGDVRHGVAYRTLPWKVYPVVSMQNATATIKEVVSSN